MSSSCYTASRPFAEILAKPLRNGLTRPKAVRGEGVKMVNMGELFKYSHIRDVEMDRVPLSDNEAQSYLLEPGDLLFARQSLVLEGAGKCSVFLGANEPVTWEGHIIRAQIDKAKADPLFYYYFFGSHQGRSAMKSIVEQVAASGIRGSDLARLSVPFPPLPVQREIAQILGAFDDKIELNRRMNETLEAMARALFKCWFVDFRPVRIKQAARERGEDPNVTLSRPTSEGLSACGDAQAGGLGLTPDIAALFPDSFVDSELGEIPAGWEAGYLGKYVKTFNGKSYTSAELQDSDMALVTLKSFKRGGGYRDDGLKPFVGKYKPEQEVKPGDLVVAHTDVTQAADVIGKPALVMPTDKYRTLVASLDAVIVRSISKDISTEFLYLLMLTDSFQAHTYSYVSGTTVLHLAKVAISEYLTCIPNGAVLRAFSEAIEPMFKKLLVQHRQIKLLEQCRDRLLPELMAGRAQALNGKEPSKGDVAG